MKRSRDVLLREWRERIASGRPLRGETLSFRQPPGESDFLVLLNSARFEGERGGILSGMMPFGDANALVLESAPAALAAAGERPLLAGVCGTDPLRLLQQLVERVREAGFAGVLNFPTVGLIDGVFRHNLEETRLGYRREVELVAIARRLDLIPAALAFTVQDASAMAEAGADLLVCHLGLSTSGPAGRRAARSPVEAAGEVDAMTAAARKIRPEILVIAHGGPLDGPATVAELFRASRTVQGYFGPPAHLDATPSLRSGS